MVLSGLTFQRVVRRAVFALLISFSATPGRSQTTEIAGTMPEDYLPQLKEILATAVRRSPSVIVPLFETELRTANRIRERAALLPSLGANLNYGTTEVSESGNNSSRSRDQGLFYNFGLNQPLFHWGALKNQYAIAKINQLIAEKNFAKAYRELAGLLRESYLGLIVQKSRVRQSRAALRMLQENITVLQERVTRGGAAAADLSGEQLRAQEAELDLSRAESELLTQRRKFARLAGIGELKEDSIPDDIPKPAFSVDLATAISAAVLRDQAKTTIEAEILDLRVRESLLRYKIDQVRLLPKFNFGAGYSLENNTTVNGDTVGQRAVTRQSFNISANWNIFDGLATRAAKMESRSVQRLQSARRDAELQDLLETVQALERELKLDARQLEVAEIRHGLAQETRRRAEEEFGFGKLPKLDIDRAQVAIALADTRRLEARAALLGRWSEFVALASEDPALNHVPFLHARPKN